MTGLEIVEMEQVLDWVGSISLLCVVLVGVWQVQEKEQEEKKLLVLMML